MSDRVTLRDVERADLDAFFEHQSDPQAAAMAAFAPRDRAAFAAHWDEILADESVHRMTIAVGEKVAGYVVCFEQAGRRLVGYWIGREFWGRGIATRALRQFLARCPERPLEALVAKHNPASIRVLEKCGFERSGETENAAGPGGVVVEEYLYSLGRTAARGA